MIDCDVCLKLWGWGVVRSERDGLLEVELLDWRLDKSSPIFVFCCLSEVLEHAPAPVGACIYVENRGTGVVIAYDRLNGSLDVRFADIDGAVSVESVEPDLIKKRLPAACQLPCQTPYGVGTVENYDHEQNSFVITLPWGRLHCPVANRDHGMTCPAAVALPAANVIATQVRGMDALLRGHVKCDDLGLWILEQFIGKNDTTDGKPPSFSSFVETLSQRTVEELGDIPTTIVEDVCAFESTPGKVSALLMEVQSRFLGADGESTHSLPALRTDLKEAARRLQNVGANLVKGVENPFGQLFDGAFFTELQERAEGSADVQRVLSELQEARAVYEKRGALIASAVAKSKTVQTLTRRLSGIHRRLSTTSAGVMGGAGGDDNGDDGRTGDGTTLLNIIGSETVRGTGMAIWQAASRRFSSNIAAQEMYARFVTDLDSQVEQVLQDVRAGAASRQHFMSLALLLNVTQEMQARFTSSSQGSDAQLGKHRQHIDLVIANALATSMALSPRITAHDLLLQVTDPAAAVASLRCRLNTLEQRVWHQVRQNSADNADGIDAAPNAQELLARLKAGEVDPVALQRYFFQRDTASIDSDLSDVADQLLSVSDGLVDRLVSLRDHESVRGLLTALQMHTGVRGSDGIGAGAVGYAIDAAAAGAESLLDTAEQALRDDNARIRLIESTKDQLVDFLLTFVPTMTIPDFEDRMNEVSYAVSDLDISAFKVRREDVSITMSGDPVGRGEDFLTCSARQISASFEGIRWRFAQEYFPHMSGEGVTEAAIRNVAIDLGFKIVRVPKGTLALLRAGKDSNARANFLFKRHTDPIFETRITAARERLATSHTSPRVKRDKIPKRRGSSSSSSSGSGSSGKSSNSETAGAKDSMDPGDIPLWRTNDVTDPLQWEPALVLNPDVMHVSIESLNLSTEGSSFSWVYNMLSRAFSSVIRDYVCLCLAAAIQDQLASLLGTLNEGLAQHLVVLQSVLSLDPMTLPPACEADVAALVGPAFDVAQLAGPPKDYTLKIEGSEAHGDRRAAGCDDEPLGISVREESRGSGRTLKRFVLATVSKTGAVACAARAAGCMAYIEGSSVRRVNGLNVLRYDEAKLLDLLAGSRPLFLGIRLSDAAYAQLKTHTAKVAGDNAVERAFKRTRKLEAIPAEFAAGPIGLMLKETRSCGGAVIVAGFARGEGDTYLQAEALGTIQVGFLMLSIQGAAEGEPEKVVFGCRFDDVMQCIGKYSRPLKVLFVPSPDQEVKLKHLPRDVSLARIGDHMIVTQGSSDLRPGTCILQINGEKVRREDTPQQAMARLQTPRPDHVPLKVAVRDLDSFMHLIRLRDGKECLQDHVTEKKNKE